MKHPITLTEGIKREGAASYLDRHTRNSLVDATSVLCHLIQNLQEHIDTQNLIIAGLETELEDERASWRRCGDAQI